MILRTNKPTLNRWSPLGSESPFHRLFDEMFERFDPNFQSEVFPALNISTNDEVMTVTAELPGLAAEDFEISVEGDTLTLKGERKAPEPKDEDTWHRKERRYGKFTRIVELPYSVDTEKVEARLQNGLLHLTLPRAEAEKPRRIAIKN
ncbi:MAG: Hsp20/alpha crystallin family protein [Opitutales bacterium]|nr:Hsp20/alpha crystallin family protein [Opitutales bacterium]